MFEAMMLRFQEDTLRNLFRMQILAPNGTPIESLEQLAELQAEASDAGCAAPSPVAAGTRGNALERWRHAGRDGAGTSASRCSTAHVQGAAAAAVCSREGDVRAEAEAPPLRADRLRQHFIQQHLGLGGQGACSVYIGLSAMRRQPASKEQAGLLDLLAMQCGHGRADCTEPTLLRAQQLFRLLPQRSGVAGGQLAQFDGRRLVPG